MTVGASTGPTPPERLPAAALEVILRALEGVRSPLAEAPGPIVPLLPRRPSEAARLQRRLFAAGIYPPFIKYPGGPPSGYFRFVISSEHSRPQLDGLLGVLLGHPSGHQP